MFIFSKQVNSINFKDIESLLDNQAQENLRLEFKRGIPEKDEIIKKISSFANTYGGYIVIGVGEDGSGKISKIDGVEIVPGFKQRIVQYCFDTVYPPIDVQVSDPIVHGGDQEKCFYVIHVPESDRTPHFINGRKGCYIRTDEFSQRFEPQLATLGELLQLTDRRARSIQFRDKLIERAEKRFATHIDLNYKNPPSLFDNIDATLSIAIVPKYPMAIPLEINQLQGFVEENRLPARQDLFPKGVPQSLNEGFYFVAPRGEKLGFSFLEINVHRLVYFALEVGESIGENQADIQPGSVIVYAGVIVAWILFYLVYAEKLYQNVGYEGPITIRIKLDRFLRRTFFIHESRFLSHSTFTDGSAYDDLIEIEYESVTEKLALEKRQLMRDIFRKIAFACGWYKAYSTDEKGIDFLIGKSLEYLHWSSNILENLELLDSHP